MDRADGGFYPKVFALVTASLLGYALVSMALPFADSILLGRPPRPPAHPLNESLARALGERRALAALLLTLGGLLLIVVPVALVAVAFASQAGELVTHIQELDRASPHLAGERPAPGADRRPRLLGGSGHSCRSVPTRSRPGSSRTAGASS